MRPLRLSHGAMSFETRSLRLAGDALSSPALRIPWGEVLILRKLLKKSLRFLGGVPGRFEELRAH